MKCHFCSYSDKYSLEQTSGTCHCHKHPIPVSTVYWESAPIVVRFTSPDNKFIVQLELISKYTVIFANDEKNEPIVLRLKEFPLTPENVHKKLPTYITFS